MKQSAFLLMISITLLCCKKKETNNYITVGGPKPAFTINGISDVVFVNNTGYPAAMALTVTYMDSAQENVTLALSGLPDGIVMDNDWVSSGIPTFSTTLTLFDTNAVGATPGSYPVSLVATTSSGKKKTYPFNVRVQGMPTVFLGAYSTCSNFCGGSSTYTDSLYADASVRNKVWFSNFANTGATIYGLIGNSGELTIPAQTIAGNTYSASATITLAAHQMTISYRKNTMNCSVTMR